MSLTTTTPLQIYVAKHAKERGGEWVSGNLVFFRMHRISDIYFVGGFGTVQWVDVANYMATKPDSIVAADPQQTISVCHLWLLLYAVLVQANPSYSWSGLNTCSCLATLRLQVHCCCGACYPAAVWPTESALRMASLYVQTNFLLAGSRQIL